MTDSVEKKIEKLKSSISKHEYNYFVLSQPTISDYEFDQLVKDLEKLEKENPHLITPDCRNSR